jgi:hypothetical protein
MNSLNVTMLLMVQMYGLQLDIANAPSIELFQWT